MGKTRLAQEFYRRIRAEYDSQQYWPDASIFHGDNLRVAPEIGDAEVIRHYESFGIEERSMPFLWWGFRLHDPRERNAALSDLASLRSTLVPHLAAAFYARRISAARQAVAEAGKEIRTAIGTSIGKKLITEAVKQIPGIGLTATVFDLLMEFSDQGKNAWTGIRAGLQKDSSIKKRNIASEGDTLTNDLLTQTINEISELLAPADRLTPLPVVIFFDDAQFSRTGQGESALRLVNTLWEKAHLADWPLMIVITHWSTEWGIDSDNNTANSCAKVFKDSAKSAHHGAIITLGKEPELDKIVPAALPQLDAADVNFLLGKADGNPQVLVELLHLIKVSPAWLKNNRTELAASARKWIRSNPTELSRLILKRLKGSETPEEVRQVVALSSLQGQQSLNTLTQKVATHFGVDGFEQGLKLAMHPHGLLVQKDRDLAAFAQRAYREASFELLSSHIGDLDEITAAVAEIASSFRHDPAYWDGLSTLEKKSLLSVIAENGEKGRSGPMRHHAGQALLDLIDILWNQQSASDIGAAAELAIRFENGLGEQWSAGDFRSSHVDLARKAIQAWHGSAHIGKIVRHQLDASRKNLDLNVALDDFIDAIDVMRNMSFHLDACNKVVEADEVHQKCLELSRARADARKDADSSRFFLTQLNDHGKLALLSDRYQAAEALFSEGLTIAGQLFEQFGSHKAKRDLSVSLDLVGQASARLNKPEIAASHMASGLKLSRELHQELDTAKSRRELLISLNNNAQIKCDQEKNADATALWLEAGELAFRAFFDEVSIQSTADLRDVIGIFGAALHRNGQCEQAIECFSNVVRWSRLAVDRFGTLKEKEYLADALVTYANGLEATSSFDLADAALVECESVLERLCRQGANALTWFNLAMIRRRIAQSLMRRQEWQASIDRLEQAKKMLSTLPEDARIAGLRRELDCVEGLLQRCTYLVAALED